MKCWPRKVGQLLSVMCHACKCWAVNRSVGVCSWVRGLDILGGLCCGGQLWHQTSVWSHKR